MDASDRIVRGPGGNSPVLGTRTVQDATRRIFSFDARSSLARSLHAAITFPSDSHIAVGTGLLQTSRDNAVYPRTVGYGRTRRSGETLNLFSSSYDDHDDVFRVTGTRAVVGPESH